MPESAAVRDVPRAASSTSSAGSCSARGSDRDGEAGGAGRTVGTTTAAGTPGARLALKRFGHFSGSITRNGAALGNVVSAEITYANNPRPHRDHPERRPHRRRRSFDRRADRPGRGALRRLVRSVSQAIARRSCELEFAYNLPAGGLHLHAHAICLPRPRIGSPDRRACRRPSTGEAARDPRHRPDVRCHPVNDVEG